MARPAAQIGLGQPAGGHERVLAGDSRSAEQLRGKCDELVK
ncbi:hypothetical protein ACFOY2_14845 [Nonomuraea purpurea]|uniref:Uncharacterized protein n=1 Tax=Nonomuraea purpurea TaxID=1849276 RepID=A0ABV8G3B8_9ACTN